MKITFLYWFLKYKFQKNILFLFYWGFGDLYVKTTKIPYIPSENAHKWKLNREFARKTGQVQTDNYETCIVGLIFV